MGDNFYLTKSDKQLKIKTSLLVVVIESISNFFYITMPIMDLQI